MVRAVCMDVWVSVLVRRYVCYDYDSQCEAHCPVFDDGFDSLLVTE